MRLGPGMDGMGPRIVGTVSGIAEIVRGISGLGQGPAGIKWEISGVGRGISRIVLSLGLKEADRYRIVPGLWRPERGLFSRKIN